MEKYTITIAEDESGYVTVKRVRDSKKARAKFSWLKPIGGGEYVPSSRTKDIRLSNLNWE
jgi:hypothetical protein